VTTLFISDLHLDSSRPAATDGFLRFLKREAAGCTSLYILGDLFEYWIGDNELNPHDRQVIAALSEFTKSGTRCFVMHGNRDFLLGEQFCRESGATLLPDPTLIYVGGESVLISHGDYLCTDDVSYQRFRKIVRDPRFKTLYSKLPLKFKQSLAKKARKKSSSSYELKPPEILDVNQRAVEQALTQFNVTTMLHGHTHRPAIHEFRLANRACKRIVLGDWYKEGSVLRWAENGPQLASLQF